MEERELSFAVVNVSMNPRVSSLSPFVFTKKKTPFVTSTYFLKSFVKTKVFSCPVLCSKYLFLADF